MSVIVFLVKFDSSPVRLVGFDRREDASTRENDGRTEGDVVVTAW
jgi:hypothetical protein